MFHLFFFHPLNWSFFLLLFFFVEQKGNINKTITYIQSKPSQTAERDFSLTTILLPYTDQYITDHKTQVNYKTASSLATYTGCVESHQVQKKKGQQICRACIIKDLSIPLRSSLFCQSICTKICFSPDASLHSLAMFQLGETCNPK